MSTTTMFRFLWKRKIPSISSLEELSKSKKFASRVHFGLSQIHAKHPDVVAQQFGLLTLEENWRSVDRDVAYSILFKLLIEDMAYNKRRLSDVQAKTLASEFLDNFSFNASFYTNGTWEAVPDYVLHGTGGGHQWIPVTSATFDGGILALDDERSGVLWIEDED